MSPATSGTQIQGAAPPNSASLTSIVGVVHGLIEGLLVPTPDRRGDPAAREHGAQVIRKDPATSFCCSFQQYASGMVAGVVPEVLVARPLVLTRGEVPPREVLR